MKKTKIKHLQKSIAVFIAAVFFPAIAFADGWVATEPYHQTLYADTLTSRTDAGAVNIADTQGLLVTGDVKTLGRIGVGTTNPSVELHLSKATGSVNHYITTDDISGTPALWLANNFAGTPNYGGMGIFAADNSLRFSTTGSFISSSVTIKPGGNVGIGTTNPNQRLDVNGNITASGTICDINGCIGSGSGNSSSQWTNSGSNIYNSNSGNVGIGTTNPAARLEIYNPTLGASILRIGSLALDQVSEHAILDFASSNVVSPTYARIAMIPAEAGVGTQTGHMTFSTINSGTLNEKMRITGAGNIGIGTTMPEAKLHIQGVITDSDTGPLLSIKNYNNEAQTTIFEAIDENSQIDVFFKGAPTEGGTPVNYFRGNVGIGTTSPGAKLEVAGQVKITGGSPGAGKVLTSDAGGLATWQDPALGIPSGAVMFFNLASCPSGWSALAAAQGRYLVGLPAGGSLAGTVGTQLANLENRVVGQHNHAITDPGHSHGLANTAATGGLTIATEYVSGSYGYYGGFIQSVTAGIGVQNAGSVTGTNAPYIQLLACQKN